MSAAPSVLVSPVVPAGVSEKTAKQPLIRNNMTKKIIHTFLSLAADDSLVEVGVEFFDVVLIVDGRTQEV